MPTVYYVQLQAYSSGTAIVQTDKGHDIYTVEVETLLLTTNEDDLGIKIVVDKPSIIENI